MSLAAVATAVKEFGSLDACYANAGISGGLVPFFEETVEHWTEVLKVNLIGTFLLAKYAAQEMVKHKRGSIICTASVAGLRSGAGGVPYSASKAGVISLVQTVANQLTGTGVRINAICPGLIETGMTRPMFERARERGTEAQDRSAQSPAALRQCRKKLLRRLCFSPPMRLLMSTVKPSRWMAACPARTPWSARAISRHQKKTAPGWARL